MKKKVLYISILDWIDPVDVYLSRYSHHPYSVWLDSSACSMQDRFSIMGASTEVIIDQLPPVECWDVEVSEPVPFAFRGGWVGFRGYEDLQLWMFLSEFVVFDHVDYKLFVVTRIPTLIIQEEFCAGTSSLGVDGAFVFSSFDFLAISKSAQVSREAYLAQIDQAKKWILEGQTYELCLSNEWQILGQFDPISTYLRLRKSNPAPYGALINTPHFSILSSSPELFFSVDSNRVVKSEPIKGTLAKADTESEIQASLQKLLSDPKLRAELWMITDLICNDISKVAVLGSLQVRSLAMVTVLETVLQLSSRIEAQLKPGLDALDVMEALFPGGSITGAPKRRTQALIQSLEQRNRGVYTGMIGYFGVTGESKMSIAIRTMKVDPTGVRFGAGGAIVADSDPEVEYEETLIKAYPLWRVL